MCATKLRPCILNGANDLVRALLQIVDCMDRSGNVYAEARAEVSEYRGRVKALKRENAEFMEVHAATIDSIESESNKFKNEVAGQRQDAEETKAVAEAAKAEACMAREELEAYNKYEAERHEAFLQSQEFKEILYPKAFKFLQVGFQSCLQQFTEAGLLPPDVAPVFPSLNKAIGAVPDDILKDTPIVVALENQEGRVEDTKTN